MEEPPRVIMTGPFHRDTAPGTMVGRLNSPGQNENAKSKPVSLFARDSNRSSWAKVRKQVTIEYSGGLRTIDSAASNPGGMSCNETNSNPMCFCSVYPGLLGCRQNCKRDCRAANPEAAGYVFLRNHGVSTGRRAQDRRVAQRSDCAPWSCGGGRLVGSLRREHTARTLLIEQELYFHGRGAGHCRRQIESRRSRVEILPDGRAGQSEQQPEADARTICSECPRATRRNRGSNPRPQ